MSVVAQRRPFTVEDFARMVDAGILAQDERVELIDGEVRQMLPIGSLHAAIVNRLNAILTEKLVHRAIVSVQNPVVLNDYSEPQPDLVVLRMKEDYYADALPGPSNVLLLIEVADTTLEYGELSASSRVRYRRRVALHRNRVADHFGQRHFSERLSVAFRSANVALLSRSERQHVQASPAFQISCKALSQSNVRAFRRQNSLQPPPRWRRSGFGCRTQRARSSRCP